MRHSETAVRFSWSVAAIRRNERLTMSRILASHGGWNIDVLVVVGVEGNVSSYVAVYARLICL